MFEMKNLYLLKISIIIMLIIACDYTDNKLKVKNNSSETICFVHDMDTILDNQESDIYYFNRNCIVPGEISSQVAFGRPYEWSDEINRSKNKKLNVFIINHDTLLKYNDWQYISINKLFKRYEYTEEELNKNNWIIEYP
jgi:hypothetical protein